MTGTKSKILQAASALFLEGGVSALSVRAIAARAGLSTIGIYSHFKGKQGILDALYIEGFEKVSTAMDVAVVDGDWRSAILDASRNYWRTAARFQAHYRLIFDDADKHFSPSINAGKAGYAAFEKLVASTSALLPDGTSREEKQKFALGIWAIVHGFTGLSQHSVASIVDIEDWEEMALDVLDKFISSNVSAIGKTAQ